jgi:PAS domain S-box-containing protein
MKMGGNMSQGNLLVVDDDPIVRDLFSRYLHDEGYSVEVAPTGEEALKVVANNSIQVALVDLGLPGMSGLSFIRTLKKEYPFIQTIIVSGIGELEDAIEAMKEQVCYYIKKPPGLTELGQTVRLVMDRFILQERNRIYQAELEVSESELRAQKAFNEEIIENVNLFVVGCDLGHRINLFNRLAETVSGYSKDEVIGQEISVIFPDASLAFLTSNNQIGLKSQPSTFEFPIRTRSGCTIDFRWTESRVADDKGNMTGWIGFGEDLTEKKALERKLIRSEKLAAIGRLSAAIAHEINNPLQGIKSNFNLITSYLKEDFDEWFRISLVSEGLNRIAMFVHRLMDVHRPRSLEIGEVDLPTLINGVCALLEPTGTKANIQFEQNWQGEALPVRGSYAELHQVFLNLVLNAIEAMSQGGKITFEMVQNEERTLVLVSDTGQGIEPKDLEFIFEPFFTTKKNTKGVGLGLSVVRGILDNLDGEIEVLKTGPEGTCFQITLPTYIASNLSNKSEEIRHEYQGTDISS